MQVVAQQGRQWPASEGTAKEVRDCAQKGLGAILGQPVEISAMDEVSHLVHTSLEEKGVLSTIRVRVAAGSCRAVRDGGVVPAGATAGRGLHRSG